MANQEKITPSPWEAIRHDNMLANGVAGRWRIIGESRKVETAELSLSPACFTDLIAILPAHSAANARLITAAPDLLEACEEVLLEVDGWIDDDVVNLIKCAIAKAEGK